MSLIVLALVAGGGALAAGVAAAVTRSKRRARQEEEERRRSEEAEALKPPKSPLTGLGFGVDLGDVIEIGGRELWLEHAWLLSEADDPVASLLRAREGVLLELPRPSSTLFLLEEVELVIAGEPPATLESRGVRFERARRLPVAVKPLGASPALPFDEAVLAEYRGLASDALFLLASAGQVKAWQGRRAEPSETERWGGGQATLE